MQRNLPAYLLALLGVAVAAFFLFFIVYSSGGDESVEETAGTAAAGGAQAVTIKDFKYLPASFNDAAGTRVTWTQQDAVAHTVTSGVRGAADAGSLFNQTLGSVGETFSFSFPQAGTFSYFCTFHLDMNASFSIGDAQVSAQTTPTGTPTLQPFTTVTPSQVQPPPTGAQLVASGLQDPRGFTWGPDGALYVAEAGTPLTQAVGGTQTGPNILFCEGWQQTKPGTPRPLNCPQVQPVYTLAGRISRIASDGSRQTVAENLPVVNGMFGFSEGPQSVAFVGNDLYVVIIHTSDPGKSQGFASGVYKVGPGGSGTLVSDIDAFNATHTRLQTPPDWDGGEPYDMVSLNGKLYITDGNAGVVYEVDPTKPNGQNTRYLADLSPGHPVLTGIAAGADGNLYVTELTKAPYPQGGAQVWRINPTSGQTTVLGSGLTLAVGIAVDPNSNIYVSEFGSIIAAPPFVAPGGRIVKFGSGGQVQAASTSVFYPTIIRWGPDGLYTTYFSIGTEAGKPAPGAIYKIPTSGLPR